MDGPSTTLRCLTGVDSQWMGTLIWAAMETISFCGNLEATTDFPLGQQRTTSRTGLAIPTTIKGWNLREKKHWELMVSCWSRPSSYLSTVKHYRDSAAMRVYEMDTYKVLKAFGSSRGRCVNLITNEYVVVQLQGMWGDQGDYVLIYDKKMLLDMKKTAEEVKVQRIEINRMGTLMGINRTSLVFAEYGLGWRRNQEHVLDLSVLNFWVGGRRNWSPKKTKMGMKPDKLRRKPS